MLREARVQSVADESVWPVLNRDNTSVDVIPAVVDEALPFRSAPATPDMPASVGSLMFGTYLSLIGALALATAGPGESGFVLAISALFVVAFFAVPRLIFAQEPDSGRRPAMDQFLARGIQTWTGHCSGRAALVQILIVPVLLTLGMLAIALEIALLG